MKKDEINIKIKTLRETVELLEKEISKLESEIFEKNIENTQEFISYYDYLTKMKGLREHTAKNYICHLKGIKFRLKKYDNVILENEIYDIFDIEKLKKIKNHIENSEIIRRDNKKQHNAFSAAFNNYMKYILDFFVEDDKYSSEFIIDE